MSYRTYNDIEISETLIKLAVNQYNYAMTSSDTGISIRTLKRWAKMPQKKGIPELLERAIAKLLIAIPADFSGQHWAITLGILIDKWLLMSGKPTSRAENITKKFGGLSEDEFTDVINEANEIITQAASGRLAEGDLPDQE